jgi:hypothetical protein
MFSPEKKPKWWQLYLSFPLLIALFVMDHRLKVSTVGHEAVQIGILLLVYGCIHAWLKANARALSGMDQRQVHGKFRVIEIPPYPLPAGQDKRPLFQLPDSEVKGVLADTFEMDVIDARLLPIDNVSEELNKE